MLDQAREQTSIPRYNPRMQKAPREFLELLLSTASPSGFEARTARVWLDYVKAFADETLTDAYGNAFAIVNPQGSPTVMFEGHSDEIGLMVSYIDDDGFLWVSAIGGVDPKMLLAKRVVVHAAEGPLPGVIGALAPHMQNPEQREHSPKITDIYIDIGASNKKEALKLVSIGTPVTVDHAPVQLLGDTLAARSCDNKIGIWSAAEGLRRYKALGGSARVVAAAHVQEEIGLNGAAMGAFRWDPDVALVVDVTNATDYPDVEMKLRNEIKMGGGPGAARRPQLPPQGGGAPGAGGGEAQDHAAARADPRPQRHQRQRDLPRAPGHPHGHPQHAQPLHAQPERDDQPEGPGPDPDAAGALRRGPKKGRALHRAPRRAQVAVISLAGPSTCASAPGRCCHHLWRCPRSRSDRQAPARGWTCRRPTARA